MSELVHETEALRYLIEVKDMMVLILLYFLAQVKTCQLIGK